MPNATAWHKGDIAAWVGAAKVMAAAGKRAILSSQNAFAADSPELWKVILPTASAVSNEGGSSPLLVPLPAVSWPWVPAWGSLEPPRRDGENAQKTGKNGEKMGEIRPKECEPRELGISGSLESLGNAAQIPAGERCAADHGVAFGHVHAALRRDVAEQRVVPLPVPHPARSPAPTNIARAVFLGTGQQ